jgi:hypothetical protein
MITTCAALGLVQSVVIRRRTVVHHPQLAPVFARAVDFR